MKTSLKNKIPSNHVAIHAESSPQDPRRLGSLCWHGRRDDAALAAKRDGTQALRKVWEQSAFLLHSSRYTPNAPHKAHMQRSHDTSGNARSMFTRLTLKNVLSCSTTIHLSSYFTPRRMIEIRRSWYTVSQLTFSLSAKSSLNLSISDDPRAWAAFFI